MHRPEVTVADWLCIQKFLIRPWLHWDVDDTRGELVPFLVCMVSPHQNLPMFQTGEGVS